MEREEGEIEREGGTESEGEGEWRRGGGIEREGVEWRGRGLPYSDPVTYVGHCHSGKNLLQVIVHATYYIQCHA